jgi:aminoglycoside phosphotransferase (APT) family kinase protein
VPVPEVYGRGEPGEGYGHVWSVLSWLPGAPLEASAFDDPTAAALQVADLIKFVRSVPADHACRFGADNNWRGAPLAPRAPYFEAALARLPDVDAGWAMRLWTATLQASPESPPVWLHGDLHPGNLLIAHGQISGVIDWGLCGVGDGACDLLTAWAMFDAAPRDVFRRAIGASDAEWLRGAGWALSMAIIYLPYAYANGLRADMSEKMIARLFEDFA